MDYPRILSTHHARKISLILVCVFGLFLYAKLGSFLDFPQAGDGRLSFVPDVNIKRKSTVVNGNTTATVAMVTAQVAVSSNRQRDVNSTSGVGYLSRDKLFSDKTTGAVALDRHGNAVHHFLRHQEDDKFGNLFEMCISQLTPSERNAFYSRWLEYRKREPSLSKWHTVGHAWNLLTRFMASLERRQRLPQVINIGAKKSGTTALSWFLAFHPEIAKSCGGEVHFFDSPNYHKGLEYYRSMMGFAADDQLVFEKTPRLFVTESAPARIANDLSSDVKFILCVRDPLKRALSDFRHESLVKSTSSRGRSNTGSRAKVEYTAAGEGAKFSASAFDSHGAVNGSFDPIRTSSYVGHFKNWLSHFSRERFLIVDHERLQTDAFHELRRVEEFLVLTPFYKGNMFYFNRTRGGTCMHGAPTRPCPPRSNSGRIPLGILSEGEERQLRNYFRPLNREFARLVGANNFTWVEL